ncbi:MAG: hypothetical protein ACK5B3_08615 [Bacteroidota bacterium]
MSKYLNYGYTNRLSKYLSKLLPDRLVFSFLVKTNSAQQNNTSSNTETIELSTLNQNNTLAKELKLLCSSYNFENNISLVVFGSFSTEELITYSDFDGVLIYDETKFINFRLIIQLRKIIEQINLYAHLQDSLQHHGILVVGKNELLNNSNSIINQLIKESKVISGDRIIRLNIQSNSNYRDSLNKLIKSIQLKLHQEAKWTNQYFFKNLLSELLLLPCSYLQYKTENYVSKKDSFELIKNHLLSNEINLISELEKIRTNWTQPIINNQDLSHTSVEKIKNNSKTQIEAISTLSEIKEDLLSFIIRLKPND